MNLQENIYRIKQVMGVIKEGLHDTSWENDEGNKITLMDLLDSTEDIPVSNISVEELKASGTLIPSGTFTIASPSYSLSVISGS